MTDKPILFSAPMVGALINGRKSQTRRVIRGVRQDNCITLRKSSKTKSGVCTHVIDSPKHPRLLPVRVEAGDRLWVRETHAFDGPVVLYCATDHVHELRKKRPSIHMPRWASRLTLIVTDVRVERVQDITEEDAKAEGVEENAWGGSYRNYREADAYYVGPTAARGSFRSLWDGLNGQRGFGWKENPWVAVYSFTIHKCNIDTMDEADG